MDVPLKIAMKNEAMAEMTELIAEAMAEMMLPMVDSGAGWIDLAG